MVEVVGKKIFVMSLFVAIFVALTVASARTQQPQVQSRIAGLESNEVYMSLLQDEAILQLREDSIARRISTIRTALSDTRTPSRRELADTILLLEQQIFDIRGAKGLLVDQINTIEQEWVLASLNSPAQIEIDTTKEQESAPKITTSRYLLHNDALRGELSDEELRALLEAQSTDVESDEYANAYIQNYQNIKQLVVSYNEATNEQDATDIYRTFDSLQLQNISIAESLNMSWERTFDEKSYAYSYILDKLGREQVLIKQETELAAALQDIEAYRGAYSSDVLLNYAIRKALIVDFELDVASELKLTEAYDSLRGVRMQLSQFEYRLPKLSIQRRYFIQYDTISFPAQPQYTYKNPIPECKVYKHGTIYRILLGTYATKRAASTFKGAYPLSYLINEDGKWCYYVGGFATLADAERAQAVLKERKFVRPEVVVWRDSVYHNLTQNPDNVNLAWRIEIDDVASLSDAVRGVIDGAGGEYELSKAGASTFLLSTFDSRAAADSLTQKIASADSTLRIKVVELAIEPAPSPEKE